MAQPYDYTLNIPDPSTKVATALQLGDMANKVKADKAGQEYELNKQKLLAQAAQNPTPQSLTRLMIQFPEMSEDFKRSYDVLDETHKQARIKEASQVYAALNAGQPDIAMDILNESAAAYRNSGQEKEAKTLEDLSKLIEVSPETAQTSAGLFLASAMGTDKFTETFTDIQKDKREEQLQLDKVRKGKADADTAASVAKFADSQAAMDLEKQGWDIYKIQQDVNIAKQNAKIATMNAELKREENQLRREKLQFDLAEAERKRDEDLRRQTSELASLQTSIDNQLSTIDRLMANPELDNVLGSIEGMEYYPSTLIGTLSPFGDGDKRADALADIHTITSQSFLNNLMEAKERGATFGSLTEREGMKLESYIQSLKTKQSEEQFRTNMKEIQRLLLKARTNNAARYGVPETIPDTPNADVSPDEIDNILNQYL